MWLSQEVGGSRLTCVGAERWAAWTHYLLAGGWSEMLLSRGGVIGMTLWGHSRTQELVRKDFGDALMSGGCRGKEQSVVGRDKGFRQGSKFWCMGGDRDRGMGHHTQIKGWCSCKL